MAAHERFGCDVCWPASADEAWKARDGLTRGRFLVEESHLDITLMSCPGCGQMFVSVLVEEIDWVDGDDPQYWSLLPLTNAEAEELSTMDAPSATAAVRGLGSERRSLKRDYPKGGAIAVRWGRGITIM